MENQNLTKNPLAEICCSLMIYIAFIVSFYILTSDSSYYFPCSTSTATYTWSLYTYYTLCASCFLHVILVPCILGWVIISENQTTIKLGSILTKILRIIISIMSLICYGYLFEAYENESCGQLSELVLAYVILVTIGLCFAAIILIAICCVGVAFGSVVVAAANAPQENSVNILVINQGKYNEFHP